MSKKTGTYAVVLITSLFFLWGFALNLNSTILVPHLKKACQLSFRESGFVDSAFYIAYFVFAAPAGLFMHKYGYKSGIIFGLLLFAVGAFLFYPAASTRVYPFFLVALFIVASGCAFLETAANPYINNLGAPEGATRRINFAQSFNGLAATLAPYIGGIFILSGKDVADQHLSGNQLSAYLQGESDAVKLPYIIIGLVVLSVAILIWRAELPDIKEHEEKDDSRSGVSIFKEKNLMLGVLGIFFYVGAQAGIQSYFIFYSKSVGGIGEKHASLLVSIAFGGFMVGRFLGSVLMKYIAPVKILLTYSIINCALLILAFSLKGSISVYALMCVPFFMSIMFPTIFSLSIRGLGERTKKGSSLLIMGIVGGAIIPPTLGMVTDLVNIRVAYLIPLICFAYIFFFAYKNIRVKNVQPVLSH
jgi:FHS family L-fucose permease-like MFS transporter